jgi:Response regulator receiver domain
MGDRAPPVTTSLGFVVKRASKHPKNTEALPAFQEHKARIMIVDNDSSLRRLLTTRLVAANYDVESAESATVALDACVRCRPNLVISDLRMTPMSGLESRSKATAKQTTDQHPLTPNRRLRHPGVRLNRGGGLVVSCRRFLVGRVFSPFSDQDATTRDCT